MIDLAFLRDNPELVKRSQEARGESPDTVDEAIAADRDRRAAITAFEELRAAQNAHGKRVAQAPKDEKAALVAEAKQLSERVKQAQHAVTAAEAASDAALAKIENIVIDGVPAGGEDDFVTLRTHGEHARLRLRAARPPRARRAARRDRHGARHEGVGQPLLLPHRHRRAPRDRAHEPRRSTGRCRPGSSRSSRRRWCAPR